MPRDVSGIYTAPSNSFNPAVDATTIDPADWNAILLDMVNQGFNVLPTDLLDGDIAVSQLDSGTNASATTFWRGDGAWEPAVIGPNSAVDNAAARFDSTTGKLIQNSALIIADTTAALSRSGNGGIPVQGTNTNDSAAAGDKGEFMDNTAGTVALTTSTTANVGQLSLTAGDWDVWVTGIFNGAGATVTSNTIIGINTVSATLPSATPFQYAHSRYAGTTDLYQTLTIGPLRVSLASPATYYGVAQAVFTTSTFSVTGAIRARRVR